MFNPNVSEEWLLGMIELEGDGFINAGGIRDKYDDEESEATADQLMQRKALGKFVELSRRKMKLTQLELAEKIKAAPVEIIEIEDGSAASVEPGTVKALAKVFKVPKDSLMVLAGLTDEPDKALMEGSVRFAACSNVPTPLQKGEEDALAAFVHTLASLQSKEAKHNVKTSTKTSRKPTRKPARTEREVLVSKGRSKK